MGNALIAVRNRLSGERSKASGIPDYAGFVVGRKGRFPVCVAAKLHRVLEFALILLYT